MESLVSHNQRDVYRCPSYRPTRDYAPPFACAFSKGEDLSVIVAFARIAFLTLCPTESKRGGKKVLAVSSEEGTVCFVDAEKKNVGECKHLSINLRTLGV